MIINIFILAALLYLGYYLGRRYERKKRIVTYRFGIQKVKGNKNIKIPKTIVQTWKTKEFNKIDTETCIYMNSWRQLNPNWDYKLYDDDDCRVFIEEFHPDALHTYDLLPKPVEKADFFRYLAILSFGGVYADVDCVCMKSIESWVGIDDEMVIGYEVSPDKEDPKYPKTPYFAQWVFAATAGHPILENLKAIIIEKVSSATMPLAMSDEDTIQRTGPAPFTAAVIKYMNDQGADIKNREKVKGLKIYSKETLSLWPEKASAESCVLHGYKGSWR